MKIYVLLFFFLFSCATIDLHKDYEPLFSDGDIRAIIEISAGTLDKWEYDLSLKKMRWDKKNGKPRVINYLPYPANYGMIPRTILPKELGGDADPLDVIVLGHSMPRGSVVKAKLIGVIKLTDKGEQDDKLIAVAKNSPLYKINNIKELDAKSYGVSNILQTWFTNYKGRGKMIFKGFGDEKEALRILNSAVKSFKKSAVNINTN